MGHGERRRKGGPSLATRLTVAFSSLSPGGGTTRAVIVAPALHCGWLRTWATERGLSVVGETDDHEQVHVLINQCKANAVIVGPLPDQKSAVAWIASLRARIGDIEIVVPDVSTVNVPVDGLTAAAARKRIMQLIESKDIETVFQPVFELVTGEIRGIEALSRFPDPGDRSPRSWFEEAEMAGLGQELELAAIRRTLVAIKNLPSDWFVSVNLSTRTFAGAQFGGLLPDLAHAQIVVELTSQKWAPNDRPLRRAMLRSRDARVRVAVDDVGASARSLVRAFELRPDIVKVDPSLVHGIDARSEKQAVVRDLVSFASDTGTTLVAEGIERSGEVDMLIELGVTHGQGYFLAPPMSLAQLRELHAARHQPH